jgi:NADH-quinone oxidoreductase subunit J
MTDFHALFFYILAGAAILCSLAVVLNKNHVSSAFALVLTFFCFAGIFALQGAHLVAALQILVYAGAIMVLFIFVIMLLGADLASFDIRRTPRLFRLAAGVLCAALLATFVWVFRHSAITGALGPFTPEAIDKAGGNTRVLSELMFSEYVLPFELTSVLLLGAIVGAVAIAKRRRPGQPPPLPPTGEGKRGVHAGP